MTGDWPVTVPWDATLQANIYPGAGANAGCPPGYIAQAIPPERTWYGGSTGAATWVCRRADDQFINNPAAIAAESGPDAVDATLINVAAAAKTTVEAVAAGGAAIGSSLMKDLAPWLIGGLVAYLLLSKGLDKIVRG